MNAVEIEEQVSALAEQAFDREEFPFSFLEAFGNKVTTIKQLRTGSSNKSDLGGVLQRNNIHLKVCALGDVSKTPQPSSKMCWITPEHRMGRWTMLCGSIR